MKITKVSHSRLKDLDPNVSPGTAFTDHMVLVKCKDGVWGEPEILPFQDLKLSPATNCLHYASGIFEGMKAFKNTKGETLMFRPEENAKRFAESAKRLGMQPIDEKLFVKTIEEYLKLDHAWIPKPESGGFLYLRPFMIGVDPHLIPKQLNEFWFLVIGSPFMPMFKSNEFHVLAAEHYSRACPGGVGYAKAAGNYAGAVLPTAEARKAGFQEVVWTDAATHKNIEECGTMNVFFVIDGVFYTPKLTDTILPGVTRASIIKLAQKLGHQVVEETVSLQKLFDAKKDNKTIEGFGCGTATVVVPFDSLTYKNEKLVFSGKKDALKIKENLEAIQYDKVPDPFNWVRKYKY